MNYYNGHGNYSCVIFDDSPREQEIIVELAPLSDGSIITRRIGHVKLTAFHAYVVPEGWVVVVIKNG